MEKGRIIFLNGVTGAGKTSIVESLQSREDILKNNPLDIVEVYCPLDICRQRNILRGDR